MSVDLEPRRGGGGGHSGGGHSSGSHASGGHSSGGSKPKSPKNPKGTRPIAGNGNRHHTTTTTTTASSSSSSSSSSTKDKKHKKTKTKSHKSISKRAKKTKTDSASATTTRDKRDQDQVTSNPFPTTLTSSTIVEREISEGMPTMTFISESIISDTATRVSCGDDFEAIAPNMLYCVAGGIIGLFIVCLAICRVFRRSNTVEEDVLEKEVYYTHLPSIIDNNFDEKRREDFDQAEVAREASPETKKD
ncbi:hypothetical protein I9W82_001581 [Candida metapsilosis]|uniref:Uncharacterized protein n=1 Tax=Candida metapsilosis TaxID=273372 RepID=A0A8H7ZIV1_9ASCO|nr:hypothetical protein I9W82_001581 [Candida metapsilosis]